MMLIGRIYTDNLSARIREIRAIRLLSKPLMNSDVYE